MIYPKCWKSYYTPLYYFIYIPRPCSKFIMGPIIRLSISHSCPTTYMNLPLNSFLYVQLQVILLYWQHYECNSTTIKCIGSYFDKIDTLLAILVHSCITDINVVHFNWLTIPLPSKHTNGGDPIRLARYCSPKTLSISLLRSVGSLSWSSNFILMSRLNWSYLVNTAIIGTWKDPSF